MRPTASAISTAARRRGALRALLTVVLVLAAAASAAAPAAAAPSQEPPDDDRLPGDEAPEPTPGTLAYEWNIAKAGTPPSLADCVNLVVAGEITAKACLERDGDKLWIKDTGAPNGLSATAAWYNYHGQTLWRQGACVNKLGSGHWGVCDKNFLESSDLTLYACDYRSSDNTWHGCGLGFNFPVH